MSELMTKANMARLTLNAYCNSTGHTFSVHRFDWTRRVADNAVAAVGHIDVVDLRAATLLERIVDVSTAVVCK